MEELLEVGRLVEDFLVKVQTSLMEEGSHKEQGGRQTEDSLLEIHMQEEQQLEETQEDSIIQEVVLLEEVSKELLEVEHREEEVSLILEISFKEEPLEVELLEVEHQEEEVSLILEISFMEEPLEVEHQEEVHREEEVSLIMEISFKEKILMEDLVLLEAEDFRREMHHKEVSLREVLKGTFLKEIRTEAALIEIY